ncbi:UPF0229 protein YeaH [Halorhodospira halochloris]|uniref:UPF0229 protein HH1059_14830 n=1 Tax=Halorhodospira halochloris TaxID=1052 RepID=A0A0X8XB51_HALHR|nr:YeaH/YhbH family protein [Halorhodospira halochloris]MBK1652597.1 hypothetical protein [Halorhodospira halochloris]BAU58188.1 UPF0229 protein YeaH [Halorhodospira halochloris]
MVNIIDRRRNPKGKSLANRQRFLRRAKRQVVDAVNEASGKRKVADVAGGEKITIPTDGLHEPVFRKSAEHGVREHVLPGNKEYVVGDTIPRPPAGSGGGSQASPSGEGEDEFTFTVSRDEFLDLFFEGLELPNMAKSQVKKSDQLTQQRAGYAVSGSPSNLNVERTMRNSLSRRIALRRPKGNEIRALEEEIDRLERSGSDPERLRELIDQLRLKKERSRSIPYIDPVDIRYNRFTQVRKPVTQAVMFCLMDVSGSMSEEMKGLAKRFFMLLYLFLERRYRYVDIVFIRHTHIAQEVDEDTFFYSRETGGTLVSPALRMMSDIVAERYPVADWNIYAAQASDGDNTPADNPHTNELIRNVILPLCQHFAYIEVGLAGHSVRLPSDLWRLYEKVSHGQAPLAMRKVRTQGDIFPVFRDLFTPAELKR